MPRRRPDMAAMSRRGMLGGLALGSLAGTGPEVALAASTLSPGSQTQGLTLGPGVHVVAANMTIKVDVLLMPGAAISVSPGRTLTLLGDFQAPIAQIFTGAGKIDLNRSRAVAAYPEWWGAMRDDAGTDCLPALHACLAAHPFMRLGAADYFIRGAFVVDRPFRRIWGAGYRSTGANRGTRLVQMDGRSDVLMVGTEERPGSVNDFLQGVDIRWIALDRSAPVNAATPDQGAGMRVRFVLFCHFEGVSANEHANAFSILGAVRTYFRDCLAFRSLNGASGGADVFRGFHLDGRKEIGLAGGNASVYLIDCNSTIGGSPRLTEATGMLLQGAFADTYIINFETSNVPIGIRMLGEADRLGAGRRRSGHADVHMFMPIIDQCATTGIEIKQTSDHCLIDIVDPYVALAPGALAAIFLESVRGLSTVSGGQIIGWVDASAGGNGIGFYALNSEGFEVMGMKVLELRRPILLQRSGDFAVAAAINNPGHPASQAAVWIEDCRRGSVRVRAKGGAGMFPQGVRVVGGRNKAMNVDFRGVDPSAVSGGAANRIVTDGMAGQVRRTPSSWEFD